MFSHYWAYGSNINIWFLVNSWLHSKKQEKRCVFVRLVFSFLARTSSFSISMIWLCFVSSHRSVFRFLQIFFSKLTHFYLNFVPLLLKKKKDHHTFSSLLFFFFLWRSRIPHHSQSLVLWHWLNVVILLFEHDSFIFLSVTS